MGYEILFTTIFILFIGAGIFFTGVLMLLIAWTTKNVRFTKMGKLAMQFVFSGAIICVVVAICLFFLFKAYRPAIC